jgi:hypothetical protein
MVLPRTLLSQDKKRIGRFFISFFGPGCEATVADQPRFLVNPMVFDPPPLAFHDTKPKALSTGLDRVYCFLDEILSEYLLVPRVREQLSRMVR